MDFQCALLGALLTFRLAWPARTLHRGSWIQGLGRGCSPSLTLGAGSRAVCREQPALTRLLTICPLFPAWRLLPLDCSIPHGHNADILFRWLHSQARHSAVKQWPSRKTSGTESRRMMQDVTCLLMRHEHGQELQGSMIHKSA